MRGVAKNKHRIFCASACRKKNCRSNKIKCLCSRINYGIILKEYTGRLSKRTARSAYGVHMPTKKTVPTEEPNKKAPRSDQASASAEERTAARRKAASSSARKASGGDSVKSLPAAKTAAARQNNPASRKNAKSEAAPGESAVPQKQGGIAKSVERIVQEKITTEETSAPAPFRRAGPGPDQKTV